jgi:putative glutamine amidotransferase
MYLTNALRMRTLPLQGRTGAQNRVQSEPEGAAEQPAAASKASPRPALTAGAPPLLALPPAPHTAADNAQTPARNNEASTTTVPQPATESASLAAAEAAPQPAAATPQPAAAAAPQPAAETTSQPAASSPGSTPAPAAGPPAQVAAEPPAEASAEPAKPKRTAASKPTIAIVVDHVPDEAQRDASIPDKATFINAHGDASLWACAQAVETSGGQVRWLTNDGTPLNEQLDGCQGVLLPGGKDIHPELYHKPAEDGAELQLGSIDFDRYEIHLAQTAMDKHLAVRGIGRGMQILNVAGNGTLRQNLPHAASHDGVVEHQTGRHRLVTLRNTSLHAMTNMEVLDVPSVHHQALDVVAPGFQIIARTADDVAEAIEKRGEPTIMGVQFHPEMNDGGSLVKRKFFEALVGDSHRVWDRTEPLPGSKPKPAATTSSKPAEQATYKPAPLPLTDERKKELLHIGLDELRKQGFAIEMSHVNGNLDHKQIDEGIDDKTTLFLKKVKNNYGTSVCSFDKGRLNELLWAFAGDDATGCLSDQTQVVLHQAKQLGAREGTTFYRKGGFLEGREPLSLRIQVAWALQDKKLEIVYRNGDGKEKKARPEDVNGLRSVLSDAEYKTPPKSNDGCGGCFGGK